jgi:hypothetical protein
LRGSDHHVFPTPLSTAALIEHPKRLSDARCVSKEHFELPSRLTARFRLYLPENLLGVLASLKRIKHFVTLAQ